jgi:hypothetical protein
MDYVLSSILPPELVDIICKEVHRKNFRNCMSQIKYCVVKIYSPKDGGFGFITSNNYNYFEALMEDDEFHFLLLDSGKRRKKQINMKCLDMSNPEFPLKNRLIIYN